MRTSGGAVAAEDRTMQAIRVLVVLVLIALAMLAVATFLLWRVADHTANGNAKGPTSTAANQGNAPTLPPPSPAGTGKQLAKQLGSTASGIKQLLAAIQVANLGALSPSLQQVIANTAVLAQAAGSFGGLLSNTSSLTTLGPSLADLQSRLGRLTTTIAPLGTGLAGANTKLGTTTKALGSTNGGLKKLTKLLGGLGGYLVQLKQSLDETRKSLDRTNQCLGRPVICQTNP